MGKVAPVLIGRAVFYRSGRLIISLGRLGFADRSRIIIQPLHGCRSRGFDVGRARGSCEKAISLVPAGVCCRIICVS